MIESETEELITSRLRLIPLTASLAHAALEGSEALGQLLDADASEDWPGEDFRDILPMLKEIATKDPSAALLTRLVVHREDRKLIGDIGFKGGPDARGAVEIGYSVIPPYRGQGYAVEAARALSEWAFSQLGVRLVTAECLEDNWASIRVLEKLGMRQTGRNGRLLLWEMPSL